MSVLRPLRAAACRPWSVNVFGRGNALTAARPALALFPQSQHRAYSSAEPVQIKPIKRIMVANRGEIAIRIYRACTELGIDSVGIFSKEDANQLHRLKADMSFPLDKNKGPIEAYLDVNYIVNVAKVRK